MTVIWPIIEHYQHYLFNPIKNSILASFLISYPTLSFCSFTSINTIWNIIIWTLSLKSRFTRQYFPIKNNFYFIYFRKNSPFMMHLQNSPKANENISIYDSSFVHISVFARKKFSAFLYVHFLSRKKLRIGAFWKEKYFEIQSENIAFRFHSLKIMLFLEWKIVIFTRRIQFFLNL